MLCMLRTLCALRALLCIETTLKSNSSQIKCGIYSHISISYGIVFVSKLKL